MGLAIHGGKEPNSMQEKIMNVADLIKKQEQEALAEEVSLADRQEAALGRLLAASDFLYLYNLLSDKEVVELDSCVHQAKKGLSKKTGLTRREAQFLKGIFILLTVIKRLLLRVPKRNLKK
jgi:hypothetical protein